MRIIGSLVIKNEADRYLKSCLEHMRPLVDDLFIWDDASTDNSVEICKEYTDHVYVRGKRDPSFLQHEGYFRLRAWETMEDKLKPQDRDWILSFDADEFLVNTLNPNGVHSSMRVARDFAIGKKCVGVVLRFPEVFDIIEGVPQIRTDGLWNTIRGPRFFAYKEGARWKDKAMGCGSEPVYVSAGRKSQTDFGLVMLHYGYANPADHRVKYERYSSLLDHGHNNSHIESIVGEKTLQPWNGPIPNVEMGYNG